MTGSGFPSFVGNPDVAAQYVGAEGGVDPFVAQLAHLCTVHRTRTKWVFVDGLARALEDTARTRQVIVFTHDERLPEAVRRLNIKSTILSITRRPKSVVEVRTALDPIRAHIEDALALVHTTDLPPEVLRSLVPGFCRSALEASFISLVRRRRLAAGRPHGEVEEGS